MASETEQPQLWTWPYALNLLATLSFFGSFFYLISVLPDYVDSIGGAPWQVGLVVAGYTAVPLLTRPLVGRYADRGHRVRMMQIGVATLVLSLALMVIAEDVWSLLVLRFAQGIGLAMFPTAAGSMVAELAPLPRRGEGVGYFGMASGAAQAAFPVLGVLVFDQWGFDAVFLTAAATAAFTLLVVSTFDEPMAAATPDLEAPTALFPRPAIFPMAVFMTVTFAIGAASAFLPLLNDERDLGNVGLYFFCLGVLSVIGRPILGLVADRYGRVVIMAPALVAAAAGMAVLAVADSTLLMLLSGALGGFGLAGTHTGAYALALDRVPDNQRGGATAVFQYAWDLGGLGGGVLLGIIASLIAVSAVFWASALIAAGGLVLLIYGRAAGWTRPAAAPPSDAAAVADTVAGGA
jgi:MFS family permease